MIGFMTERAHEQSIAILETFVLRARRVAAHSLAQDPRALQKLAKREIDFVVEGDEVYLVEKLPPEEQIESAAARVRPMILQRDSTHWAKVMNALGYFIRDTEPFTTEVKRLREAWRGIEDLKENAGVWLETTDAAGETSDRVSSISLAYAYLYGDVIHHDPARLARVEGFELTHRYQEAVSLVARVMARTLATLNLTIAVSRQGMIDLNPRVFESEVAVSVTELRTLTRAWLAPIGTEIPETGADLDEHRSSEWVRITPELLNGMSHPVQYDVE